jgi:ribosomal protein RSM22 (predicted rRNA methylase)
VEKFVREARQRFRDTLPKGYLTKEEYQLYERLYGPPLRETEPEDVGIPFKGEPLNPYSGLEQSELALLDEVENRLSELEVEGKEVNEDAEEAGLSQPEQAEELGKIIYTQQYESDLLREPLADAEALTDNPDGYINAVARNQREYDALVKLQKDFEAASLQAMEHSQEAEAEAEEMVMEEEDEEFEEDEEREYEREDEGAIREPGYGFNDPDQAQRMHLFTREGKFKTIPSTLQLARSTFVEPVQTLLKRTAMSHVTQAALATFGGPGLPYSPASPQSKKNIPMKPIGLEAGQHSMSEIEADAYIAAFLPPAYASIISILVEIRKRMGTEWVRKLMARGEGQGPRVLDAGAGGAGLLAWQDVLDAEWEIMREEGEAKGLDPPGKKTVIVGSDALRHRISRLLHNTQFLPRMPDYVHLETKEEHIDGPRVPQPRKTYDIIIASHLLFPVKEGHRRKAVLNQLWSLLSPEGGVLIVLEKGHPRGFEAVAEVRRLLLDEYLISPGETKAPQSAEIPPSILRVREPGWVIAPCTNHFACPMYLQPGESKGRKDFCHFSQRYVRPPFLQQVLGASARNHDDVEFSYLAVQRGAQPSPDRLRPDELMDKAIKGYEHDAEPPSMRHLPRNILPPIKRKGHVTLDLCTPAGRIERWTVPKSFSHAAYRDARKAQWGDLWALGAKTRVPRNVRIGRGVVDDDGGVRAARAIAKGDKKKRVVNVGFSPGGVSVHETGHRNNRPERRTKGGRRPKPRNLEEELTVNDD